MTDASKYVDPDLTAGIAPDQTESATANMKTLAVQYALLENQEEEIGKVAAELARQKKQLESDMKRAMNAAGINAFSAPGVGMFNREEKMSFRIPADKKDEAIAWFKADPELKNLVKVKEDVAWNSAEKIFRTMYNDEGRVEPFVKIDTFDLITFKREKKA